MKWRPHSFLLGIGVFVSACASQTEPPISLSLKPYVGRLVSLDAEIGDHKATMLFDSGAGVTAITPEMTDALDCAPYGRLVGHRMSGERVEFERCGSQSIMFDDFKATSDVYVFDLMALLPDDLPPLGGIVSLVSFAGRPFTLDLSGQELIVETQSSFRERIKGARQGDLRVKTDTSGEGDVTVLVRIEAQTGDLWFLLDSANLDHVFISKHALDQLGKAVDSGSALEADGLLELDFEISGAYPVSAMARIRDTLYDGVLNENVMRRFLITFDLENEKIWFSNVNDAVSVNDPN